MEYKWRIFLANLDPVIGSEQGQTRPVLIISGKNSGYIQQEDYDNKRRGNKSDFTSSECASYNFKKTGKENLSE